MLCQQRDQRPADAAVAIKERMDGLELPVGERNSHHRGEIAARVQPRFQFPRCAGDVLGRWVHETGIAGPTVADPVLRPPDFTRQLVYTPDALHEDAVGVAKQADAQRQVFGVGKLFSGMRESCDIVACPFDVGEAVALLSRLEGEGIAERALSPFDLRGDDRFLANEAVEEPIGAGNHGAFHGKTGEDRLCIRVEFGRVSVDCEGRIGRRQRVGDEGANLLPPPRCLRRDSGRSGDSWLRGTPFVRAILTNQSFLCPGLNESIASQLTGDRAILWLCRGRHNARFAAHMFMPLI